MHGLLHMISQKQKKIYPRGKINMRRNSRKSFLFHAHFLHKKNMPWHILAPRAVTCDNLHLRASAHLWHISVFLCNREFLGIFCYIKNPASTGFFIQQIRDH